MAIRPDDGDFGKKPNSKEPIAGRFRLERIEDGE